MALLPQLGHPASSIPTSRAAAILGLRAPSGIRDLTIERESPRVVPAK
ncbi:MAG: hypothetical protein ACP5LG_04945 [Conexivisphaera sp.]